MLGLRAQIVLALAVTFIASSVSLATVAIKLSDHARAIDRQRYREQVVSLVTADGPRDRESAAPPGAAAVGQVQSEGEEGLGGEG